MPSAFQGLYVLLMFSQVLNYTVGSDTGCEDWTLSGSHDVCCKRCKPGNRLVESCGREPEKLCTPCEPGTYTVTFDMSCLRCTQCVGVQFTLKPCTISSDTVCGCKAGYRCGNAECSFCVTECKEGEEPTKKRMCKKCPPGTFNDKVHSSCREFKSCPDGEILFKGNATSDAICKNSGKKSEQDTLPVKKEEPPEQTIWLPVFIAGGMAGLAGLCIIASVVAYVKAQNKTEKKPKTDSTDQDNSDESRIMIVEQEDCSCRRPEQEQGGSSESINTQDSESKLIV
ncbi:tumor necrosis factor receptor superfamily member 9a [Ctenopharyngodon idella]|uniref:tumor necrosis factor receptor superfamily member 9a n=1 Tax=Ctenopharyngodon idella TaxID=7959 RepID=UPI00222F742B|nr:tumor necrosis factor receptor superfamily member 9a [Ctenopharyngodon idella]XP_051735056.1 tumor necrosis factor receptor superfamily member 9a [Ctenopharyngodon idella]